MKVEQFNLVGVVPWRKRFRFLWNGLTSKCHCYNCRERNFQIFYFGY